jgi:ABC-2 type transport system permease protein
VDGSFLLGVEVAETVGEEQTRFVVYSGKFLWDDSYLSETSFANQDLLYNSINKMTGQENVMTVRSISLAEDTLAMTQGQKNRIGLMVMGVIPLAFIVPGIMVVVHRRKK